MFLNAIVDTIGGSFYYPVMIWTALMILLYLTVYLTPEIAPPGHEFANLGLFKMPSWIFILIVSTIFLALVISLLFYRRVPSKKDSVKNIFRMVLVFLALIYVFEVASRFDLQTGTEGPCIVLQGRRCFDDNSVAAMHDVEIRQIPLTPARIAVAGFMLLLGLAVLLFLFVKPMPIPIFMLLAIIGSVLVRIIWFRLSPLDPQRTDQLPTIAAACETFLRGGFPYATYDWGTHAHLLYFFPGIWMPYLPFIAMGIDLRFWGLLCVVATFMLFYRASSRLDQFRAAQVRLLLAALLLLPLTVGHDANFQFQFFHLTMVGVYLAIAYRRYWTSCLLYGLALGTSHFAVIFAPVLFIYLRKRQTGKQLAWKVSVAAAFPILFLLPFFLWNREQFLYYFFEPFRQSGSTEGWFPWSGSFLGYANLFRWSATSILRPFVQFIAVMGVYTVAWFKMRTTLDLLRYSILVYLVCVMFNALIEMHMYDLIYWLLLLYPILYNSNGRVSTHTPKLASEQIPS